MNVLFPCVYPWYIWSSFRVISNIVRIFRYQYSIAMCNWDTCMSLRRRNIWLIDWSVHFKVSVFWEGNSLKGNTLILEKPVNWVAMKLTDWFLCDSNFGLWWVNIEEKSEIKWSFNLHSILLMNLKKGSYRAIIFILSLLYFTHKLFKICIAMAYEALYENS